LCQAELEDAAVGTTKSGGLAAGEVNDHDGIAAAAGESYAELWVR
jgi:hypothetical protein